MSLTKWTDEDKQKVVQEMKRLVSLEDGKIGQARIMLEAQNVLEPEKRYGETSVTQNLPKFWEELSPYLEETITCRLWGWGKSKRAGSEAEEPKLPAATAEELYQRIRDKLLEDIANLLPFEAERAVGEVLAKLLPADQKPRSPSELRKAAVAYASQPSMVKKPRVSVFGLVDTQHEAPKLNPFKKAVDLRLFSPVDNVDVIKDSAEKSDFVFVLINHLPPLQLKAAKDGANGKYIPVYGGTSALEVALHTVCVAHRIPVSIVEKTHPEIKGVGA
jgi:hypothetical protein